MSRAPGAVFVRRGVRRAAVSHFLCLRCPRCGCSDCSVVPEASGLRGKRRCRRAAGGLASGRASSWNDASGSRRFCADGVAALDATCSGEREGGNSARRSLACGARRARRGGGKRSWKRAGSCYRFFVHSRIEPHRCTASHRGPRMARDQGRAASCCVRRSGRISIALSGGCGERNSDASRAGECARSRRCVGRAHRAGAHRCVVRDERTSSCKGSRQLVRADCIRCGHMCASELGGRA